MGSLLGRGWVVAALAACIVLGVSAVAVSSSLFEKPSPAFKYFGPAADASDPDNLGDNDVARFDTTSGAPVGMRRDVREQVSELDNQLGFKYFMQNRNCGAGSPRIDLFVDTNGDGKWSAGQDGVLEGHVQPGFHCPEQNKWVYQDLTDDLSRWGSRGNLPGGPGNAYTQWSVVEAGFGVLEVVFGQLVEDSQAFKPDNHGIAFYDLVSLGNRTYEDHSDAAR